ncbi:MAG: zinc ribbon domain-containing protein [Methanoregula sp.]|nr:zinc ribbon domain-containing protein [Methanoregula sp.]
MSNGESGTFCGECGTLNPDTNRFCKNCGTPLRRSQPSAAPAPVTPAPVDAYPPAPPDYYVPPPPAVPAPVAAYPPAPQGVPVLPPQAPSGYTLVPVRTAMDILLTLAGIAGFLISGISWFMYPYICGILSIVLGGVVLYKSKKKLSKTTIIAILGIIIGLSSIIVNIFYMDIFPPKSV